MAASLLVMASTACAGPGAGRQPAVEPSPTLPGAPAARAYAPADVEFMRGMIAHHRQALTMTDLAEERAESAAVRLLAERIEVSQGDEIAQMIQWLRTRGEEIPPPGAHAHRHEHGEMAPGMLTPEEMARLAGATGAEFDRLFLELMIRHHEGALAMVGELLATPGAGEDVDTFRIAAEVDSDQRIEIERMERMLSTLD